MLLSEKNRNNHEILYRDQETNAFTSIVNNMTCTYENKYIYTYVQHVSAQVFVC